MTLAIRPLVVLVVLNATLFVSFATESSAVFFVGAALVGVVLTASYRSAVRRSALDDDAELHHLFYPSYYRAVLPENRVKRYLGLQLVLMSGVIVFMVMLVVAPLLSLLAEVADDLS